MLVSFAFTCLYIPLMCSLEPSESTGLCEPCIGYFTAADCRRVRGRFWRSSCSSACSCCTSMRDSESWLSVAPSNRNEDKPVE